MSEKPQAVLLIHGTYSYDKVDTAEPDERTGSVSPKWWQLNSAFVAQLDRLLDGTAECWPGSDEESHCQWQGPPHWYQRGQWNKFRLYNRRIFVWTGRNSDSDRRAAGQRLYDEGLKKLEDTGVEYHLVGHSHGGTVIWNALRAAETDGNVLPNLKSWSTMGTPFPVFRPVVGLWVSRLAILLALCVLGIFLLRLTGHTFPGSIPRSHIVDVFWSGLSVPSKTGVLIVGGIIGFVTFGLLISIFRAAQHSRERRRGRQTWSRHGGKWLGLFSRQDEAIAGTHCTVGFYVPDLIRWPWPGAPPIPRVSTHVSLLRNCMVVVAWLFSCILWAASWFFAPALNLVIIPVAEWVVSFVLGPQAHSADRLGTALCYISAEPWFHSSYRGPLPEQLENELSRCIASKVASRDGTWFEHLMNNFTDQSQTPQPLGGLIRELLGGLYVTDELRHNSYYDTAGIQLAISTQILAHARRAPGASVSEEDVSTAYQESLARISGKAEPTQHNSVSIADVRERQQIVRWLCVTPDGRAEDQFPPKARATEHLPQHRMRPRSTNATPARPRIVLFAAFFVSLLLLTPGVLDDIRRIYIPLLVERAVHGDGADSQEKVALNQLQPLTEDALGRLVETKLTGDRIGAAESIRLLNEVSAGTVESLGRAIRDIDSGPQLKTAAAVSLVHLAENGHRDLEVVNQFLTALVSDDVNARRLASFAFGKFAPARTDVVQALTKAVDDGDHYVAARAIYALGEINIPEESAIRGLVQKLDTGFAFSAKRSLSIIAGKDKEAVIRELLAAWKSTVRSTVRYDVVELLGRLGDDRDAIVMPLIELADDDSRYAHKQAIQALGEIGVAHECVVSTLIAMAVDKEKNEYSRESALQSLGKLAAADDDAADVWVDQKFTSDSLDARIPDGEPSRRRLVAAVLRMLKIEVDPGRVIRAIHLLEELDASGDDAVQTLVSIMRKNADPAPITILDPYIAQGKRILDLADSLLLADSTQAAWNSLHSYGIEWIESKNRLTMLPSALNYTVECKTRARVRRDVVTAMGEVGHGNEEVLPILIDAIGDQSVEYEATESLKRLAVAGLPVEEKVRLAFDAGRIDPFAAKNILSEIGRLKEPTLTWLLDRTDKDSANYVTDSVERHYLVETLGNVPNESDLVDARLLAMLGTDENDMVRKTAAKALAKRRFHNDDKPSSQLVDALKKTLDSKHSDLQVEAAGTLLKWRYSDAHVLSVLVNELKTNLAEGSFSNAAAYLGAADWETPFDATVLIDALNYKRFRRPATVALGRLFRTSSGASDPDLAALKPLLAFLNRKDLATFDRQDSLKAVSAYATKSPEAANAVVRWLEDLRSAEFVDAEWVTNPVVAAAIKKAFTDKFMSLSLIGAMGRSDNPHLFLEELLEIANPLDKQDFFFSAAAIDELGNLGLSDQRIQAVLKLAMKQPNSIYAVAERAENSLWKLARINKPLLAELVRTSARPSTLQTKSFEQQLTDLGLPAVPRFSIMLQRESKLPARDAILEQLARVPDAASACRLTAPWVDLPNLYPDK